MQCSTALRALFEVEPPTEEKAEHERDQQRSTDPWRWRPRCSAAAAQLSKRAVTQLAARARYSRADGEASGVARSAPTQERINRVLPALLAERGLSQRALARSIGVNQSHISRVLAENPKLPPSKQLCAQIAGALGLPTDYFVEYREAEVIEAIRRDTALRERIYRGLSRQR